MKLPHSLSIAFALSSAILVGCDTGANTPEPSDNGIPGFPGTLPAGAKVLKVAGRVHDTTGDVKIKLNDKSVTPDASGNYTITDTVLAAPSAPIDTVRIIVSTPSRTDTLREVPLTSWSTILTPLSVVANDISVNAATGSRVSGRILEAVWWSDDTIAHVQHVPNSTSADYFSTTIYTLYNDSAYAVNGRKYSMFLRVKNKTTDTVPLYRTSIRDIGAQNGALNYTDTFFREVVADSVTGLAFVPEDANVIKYSIKHAITPADTLVIDTFKKSRNILDALVDSVYRVQSCYSKQIVEFDVDSAALAKEFLRWGIAKVDSVRFYTSLGDAYFPLTAGHKTFVINAPTVYSYNAGLSVFMVSLSKPPYGSVLNTIKNLRITHIK